MAYGEWVDNGTGFRMRMYLYPLFAGFVSAISETKILVAGARRERVLLQRLRGWL